MVHAFLLFVFVGVGEEQKLVNKDMYFRDIRDCVWFAQSLHKQGNKITAYCLPQLVPEGAKIYD